MYDNVYTIQVFHQTGFWVLGTINEFSFEAKVYDTGSNFGIDNGRVSKLTISSEHSSREVVGYERGWETYPETRELEDMMEALLRFCEGLPPYEVRFTRPLCFTTTVTQQREVSRMERNGTMKLNYKVMGETRKELVYALAEIVGADAQYLGAPSFSYKAGNYIVDKFGTVICPELVMEETVDDIVQKLYKKGFEVDSIDKTLTVQLPRSQYDQYALFRLEQLIRNKEPLFKRAFQTESLVIQKDTEKLSFPWFTLTGNPNEAEAYTTFISAIGKMAREQKRVIPQVYAGNNDKYAMRLFLVRRGLKGKEYKETRKILMRNLTGNGAWRDGAPPGRVRTQSEVDVD